MLRLAARYGAAPADENFISRARGQRQIHQQVLRLESQPVGRVASHAQINRASGDVGAHHRGIRELEAEQGEHPGEALYAARLAVDRARLAFLELSPDERRAHLEAHAERRAQADAEQPELAAQREARRRAERAAEQVAAERQRVVRQMEAAQSQASRAIARERATLLGVREAQSTFELALHEREQLRAARTERVSG